MDRRFHHAEENHCCEEGHTHCGHGCGGGCAERPKDKTKALLGYMLEHNRHHVTELEELAETIGGKTEKDLDEAIGLFCRANEKLAAVLAEME